jgi:nucleoside-diphosphate-sugar epimerase
MKRALITGATGFIGRHCLPLLVARGYEVYAVSSWRITANESNIHWHQADLLDSPQVATLIAEVQPSYLLHFAWYTVPGKYWTSTENLRWVQASIGLLREFARHGGQRVVMAGTCAEYDWRYGYCSEAATPLAPVTFYGICKHSLQLMLAAFSKQTGLSAAWGRIFFLFGPHEHPDRLVAYVIRSLLREEPARCSHGSQIRDFLYVQDVAEAFVALLESEVSGPVNIASGQPVTLRELIHRIAAKFNRNDLVELDAVPTSPDEPPLLVADVRRLHDEVGWAPKYDLDTGLDQTIDWWKHESKQ